jgi:NTP pyrophosphatase (non-canonical NTP hydrolase)
MPSDSDTTLQDLRDLALRFRDARDWRQFHTPKDLALAIGIEAGELGELFLWTSDGDIDARDPTFREQAGDEIADVLIFLLYMAEALDIDVANAVVDKIQANEERYPVDKSRGVADKYTNLL